MISFSQSLEHFFLTVGQNNFGNKIPFFFHSQGNDPLQYHKKSVHVDKTKLDFKCEKCDFASYARRYVLEHVKKVHCAPAELKQVCEHCGEKFLYLSQLKVHYVIISLLKS